VIGGSERREGGRKVQNLGPRVPPTRLRARREGGFDSSQRVSRVPPSRPREKNPAHIDEKEPGDDQKH